MNFKLLALGLTGEVIYITPGVAKSTFVLFFLMALLRLNKPGYYVVIHGEVVFSLLIFYLWNQVRFN